MKNNIEHTLETTRPSLSPTEQELMWGAIQENLVSEPVLSPYMRWVRERVQVVAVLLILIIVLVGGGTSARADEARPGDFLFPLDRALERVSLSLASSHEKRSLIGKRHAEERINELREMIKDSGEQTSELEKTHSTVSAAVDALIMVMDESNMSDTARERVYEKLFIEIDPLFIDVRVEDSGSQKSERVVVSTDSEGETKIEIQDHVKRTRIEKKDGVVKFEYSEGDVRGEKTSREEEKEKEDKGKGSGDERGRGN